MTVSSPEPSSRPTLAQIERAWRGPPTWPDDDAGPPPPARSHRARQIDRALLLVVACLFALAGAGLVFPLSARVIFSALGAANVLGVLVGLRTHRMLGIAFRSRFIGRREREPVLYWASLAMVAIVGAFLVFIALMLTN